ncbi:hexokinase-1-like [Argonauta hians]
MIPAMTFPDSLINSAFTEDQTAKIRELFNKFVVSPAQLEQIKTVTEDNMRCGCSSDTVEQGKTTLLMENTFIEKNLSGNENGTFLGLDLGGTNLRLFRVRFTDGKADTNLKYYKMPEHCFKGPSRQVFDFMADCIEDFLKHDNLTECGRLPLGFTFSFPSTKKSLTDVELIIWTKTFKCTDGPGMNVGKTLEDCLNSKNVPVDVVAIISDVTAALVAGHYLDTHSCIGLILGTGCNVCYVENVSSVDKWKTEADKSKKVIINVEWGGLSDTGCLSFVQNEFDKEVDRLSNHVNSFTFEKMFSGLYLGELVRQVLVNLTNEKILFQGTGSPQLFTPWSWDSSNVSAIERDSDGSDEHTLKVLNSFGLGEVTSKKDVILVQFVCSFMSQRGAYILAAGLSAVVERAKQPEVTIAVDGSLYEQHPKYHGYMMAVMSTLSPHVKTNIVMVKDSSVQGCAFAAAIVQ